MMLFSIKSMLYSVNYFIIAYTAFRCYTVVETVIRGVIYCEVR